MLEKNCWDESHLQSWRLSQVTHHRKLVSDINTVKSEPCDIYAASVKARESKYNSANVINISCSNFNRDLSCNKILSIEEHAFEPLPFLQLMWVVKISF